MPKNKEYIDNEQLSFDTLSSILTGCLRSDHELQALKYLFEKYNCRTVSEESKSSSISRQTIYNRIKSGEVATIELGSVNFIIF